jgi:hypothetical protein
MCSCQNKIGKTMKRKKVKGIPVERILAVGAGGAAIVLANKVLADTGIVVDGTTSKYVAPAIETAVGVVLMTQFKDPMIQDIGLGMIGGAGVGLLDATGLISGVNFLNLPQRRIAGGQPMMTRERIF